MLEQIAIPILLFVIFIVFPIATFIYILLAPPLRHDGTRRYIRHNKG